MYNVSDLKKELLDGIVVNIAEIQATIAVPVGGEDGCNTSIHQKKMMTFGRMQKIFHFRIMKPSSAQCVKEPVLAITPSN